MQSKDFIAVKPANATVLKEDELKAKQVSLGKSANCLPMNATITIPADVIDNVIVAQVDVNGRTVDSYQIPAEVNGEKKYLTVSRFVSHIYADELGDLGKYLDEHKDSCKTMIDASNGDTLFARVSALAGKTLIVSKRFALPYTPYGKTTPSTRVFTVYEDKPQDGE